MGAFSFGPFMCWTFAPLAACRQYENLSARTSVTPNEGGSCDWAPTYVPLVLNHASIAGVACCRLMEALTWFAESSSCC